MNAGLKSLSECIDQLQAQRATANKFTKRLDKDAQFKRWAPSFVKDLNKSLETDEDANELVDMVVAAKKSKDSQKKLAAEIESLYGDDAVKKISTIEMMIKTIADGAAEHSSKIQRIVDSEGADLSNKKARGSLGSG